jgi:glutamate racemase
MEQLTQYSPRLTGSIGVFDSGVGGISVLKHIHTLLPAEDIIYVADSKHAPYGNQPPTFIVERALHIGHFLVSQGVKAIVIACNTATAAAAEALRREFSIPIIGMEPAVKPAAQATKTGIIGVLATSGTLKSAQFAALLEHYGQQVTVVTQACHGLVESVEKGNLEGESVVHLLRQYIEPLIAKGADTLVLGCTHYPFLRPMIEKITDHRMEIIDTGMAVARQLKHRLDQVDLNQAVTHQGIVSFWSNANPNEASQVIGQLWGKPVELNWLGV